MYVEEVNERDIFVATAHADTPGSEASVLDDDDPSFIVLTETKFSFHCIPVWDRYSPNTPPRPRPPTRPWSTPLNPL
jgi:hypothetical protein